MHCSSQKWNRGIDLSWNDATLLFTYALSFYRSKLYLSGPNHFGQVQIRFLWTNFYDLVPTKIIWTRPKRIGLDQNDLDGPKSFWTHRRTRHNSNGTKVKICTLIILINNFVYWHWLIYQKKYKYKFQPIVSRVEPNSSWSHLWKVEMWKDIHLQMLNILTFDEDLFLPFGWGKFNQNWLTGL